MKNKKPPEEIQNSSGGFYMCIGMYFYISSYVTSYPTWLPGFTLPKSEVTLRLPSKLTAERIIP